MNVSIALALSSVLSCLSWCRSFRKLKCIARKLLVLRYAHQVSPSLCIVKPSFYTDPQQVFVMPVSVALPIFSLFNFAVRFTGSVAARTRVLA